MEPDPAIVAQLMSMGFGENGSKRAVIATQVAETPGLRPRSNPVATLCPGICLLRQLQNVVRLRTPIHRGPVVAKGLSG